MEEEKQALNDSGKEEVPETGKGPRPFNMNHYATKKSAAQSMLDVALLMANSSQLKTVLHAGPQHRFYVALFVLISFSISLQVIVGLLLIFIVKYDLNDVKKQPRLNKMNDAATIFVFCTVLINIFITALGFESGQSSVVPGIALAQTSSYNISEDV
ncbi:ninjurin-2-like [Triplophysa dalaica]|uniref:ninjurin-2-like n=1 Tax=Triplophysa dalaica TaxID=1582913 RepID=UPI0024E02DE9|nr:ninjurin-2-like [Triplophysa dalaica]